MTVSPDLAEILRDERERIVSRFVLETQRAHVPPPGVSRSLLVDHIPRFLDELMAALAEAREAPADGEIAAADTAREHGEQRWRLGYDLEALAREYRILWGCILGVAKESATEVRIGEIEIFAKYMGAALDEATSAYTKHRDAEVEGHRSNLEFLADAGQLLSSSLDYRSTLHRLAGLIVPKMADWCAIHLEGTGVEEMPLMHVDPAKVAILRELYRRDPLGDSPPSYERVVRTGEPVFVPEVEAELFEANAATPEHLALLRAIHTTSWIVVPLAVQGQRFGALTLGFSESPRRYTERDLVVASDLARRAALALDNARIFELSQNERSRAEAATRAKDEFVAMVSHELRTPLNAILGWLSLMRSGSLSPEKREHALDVIERNAKAQSRLVGDLLDISRTLTGTIRISFSRVGMSSVVDQVIEAVRPTADAKRVTIEVDIDRENAVLRGDGDRLQQVVWNLLVNAVKFTPRGGVVKVRVRRVEADLELAVEDSGEGIPANFLPHVFDSFRQGDGSTTRAHGGLGVGLSIAKHIVELHGGAIEVRSEGEGRGATFTVRLPIDPVVSATAGVARAPATEEPSPGVTVPAVHEPMRVLVVDDEPDARDLLAYVFETSGVEARLAGSTAEAMSVLDEFVPNVLVSDIGMPDEDGYALIRRVRTLADERKNIPAIALTAFARDEDRKRALVDGFNLHMAKPVEPAKLVHAVLELARATTPATRR